MNEFLIGMNVSQRRFSSIFSMMVVGWWLASTVNGALPQLQMLLLGGHVVIPTWFMRGLLLLAIMVYGLRDRYRLYPSSVGIWWLVFMVYLLLDVIVHLITEDARLSYVAQGIYQYYFLLVAIVFCPHLGGSLDDRWMTPLLLLSFLPLGALGVAQYMTSEPIVEVASVDGYFQVIAWSSWYYSGIRAFSLFRSASEFGHYSALIGGVLIAVWLRRGNFDPIKSLLVMLMLVLVLTSVYVAKARIAYIVTMATVLAAVWIAPRRRLTPSMLALPLLFAGVAYFVAVAAPQIVRAMGFRLEGLIFSDTSLHYRWEAWSQFADIWFGSGWPRALLGAGLFQHQGGDLSGETGILIDNAFIAVGLHAGLIGLALWLVLIWKLWRYVLETAIRRQTALSLGVAAYWATLPMSLMYSSALSLYLLPLMLVMFEKEPSEQPQVAQEFTELAASARA